MSPMKQHTNAVFCDRESIENELGVEIPSKYLCPITMEIMIHPVTTNTGFNFEGYAIVSWLLTSPGTCPLTRKPLDSSKIVPNHALDAEIAQWREENGISDVYDKATRSFVSSIREKLEKQKSSSRRRGFHAITA